MSKTMDNRGGAKLENNAIKAANMDGFYTDWSFVIGTRKKYLKN